MAETIRLRGEDAEASIVDPTEAAEIRAAATGGRRRPGFVSALVEGKMLRFSDGRPHADYGNLRRRWGMRLRQRSDGSGGTYVWAEPIEDTP